MEPALAGRREDPEALALADQDPEPSTVLVAEPEALAVAEQGLGSSMPAGHPERRREPAVELAGTEAGHH